MMNSPTLKCCISGSSHSHQLKQNKSLAQYHYNNAFTNPEAAAIMILRFCILGKTGELALLTFQLPKLWGERKSWRGQIKINGYDVPCPITYMSFITIVQKRMVRVEEIYLLLPSVSIYALELPKKKKTSKGGHWCKKYWKRSERNEDVLNIMEGKGKEKFNKGLSNAQLKKVEEIKESL